MTKKIGILIVFVLMANLFAQNEMAKLSYLLGDVMVHLPGENSAKVANWNMNLPDGTIVMTGAESRAEITFPDGSIIRLTEKSHFKIKNSTYKNKKRAYLFEILKGGIFGKIKKFIMGEVSIKSPVAVIAIRGTEFGVWHVSESKDEISVLEGKVQVYDQNMKNFTFITTGKKLIVLKDQPLGLPVPLSRMERMYLENLSRDASFKVKPTTPRPETKPETPGEKKEKSKIYRPTLPTEPQPQKPTRNTGKTTGGETPVPGSGGEGLNMGGGIGAVTMDGQTYTQLAFRPELTLGKLNVVFDITLYMDQDGKIRKENWDEVSDILEKIYYVQWARRGDPFHIKLGAIDNYTLGFGLLMNRYANTVEYPNVIRTGMELGIQKGNWYLEAMVNDVKEFTKPGGLVGVKATYRLPFGLEVGGMLIHDINQYAALSDADNDGAPDVLDDFPNDKNYQVDTDGDGIPDAFDPDVDGDGYTDNSQDPNIPNNDPDGITNQKPQPFNIKDNKNSVTGWGANLAFPLVKGKLFSLIPYAEVAGIFGYGYGFSMPGIMGNIGFLNYKAEYRQTFKEFIPEYFNQTYEIDRVKMVRDSSGNLIPVTKEESLKEVQETMRGWLAGTGFQLFHLINFYAEYQNMKTSQRKYNSLRAEATINTKFIPKIKQATAYYNQYNVKKIFTPSDGTILGYRVMYEISPGAYFLVDYRQTYRDVNGDGKYRGSDEINKTFNVGTYFNF